MFLCTIKAENYFFHLTGRGKEQRGMCWPSVWWKREGQACDPEKHTLWDSTPFWVFLSLLWLWTFLHSRHFVTTFLFSVSCLSFLCGPELMQSVAIHCWLFPWLLGCNLWGYSTSPTPSWDLPNSFLLPVLSIPRCSPGRLCIRLKHSAALERLFVLTKGTSGLPWCQHIVNSL